MYVDENACLVDRIHRLSFLLSKYNYFDLPIETRLLILECCHVGCINI